MLKPPCDLADVETDVVGMYLSPVSPRTLDAILHLLTLAARYRMLTKNKD